ncbi:MAG: hypothetical protein KJ709_07230 [Nanoarchaeota archaeon]|nr:hypothetical protein [Nanoarchaeota archaeon]
MQTDIKCAECGKVTRRFQLGNVYYNTQKTSSPIIVKDSITCPKCKADISQGKCMVRMSNVYMSFIAINILAADNEPIPPHLQGAIPLRRQEYQQIAKTCKARLRQVSIFKPDRKP